MGSFTASYDKDNQAFILTDLIKVRHYSKIHEKHFTTEDTKDTKDTQTQSTPLTTMDTKDTKDTLLAFFVSFVSCVPAFCKEIPGFDETNIQPYACSICGKSGVNMTLKTIFNTTTKIK